MPTRMLPGRATPLALRGLRVVVTGIIGSLTREEVCQELRAAGALPQARITRATQLLVVGRSPGQEKLDRARRDGLPQATEGELLTALRYDGPSSTTPAIVGGLATSGWQPCADCGGRLSWSFDVALDRYAIAHAFPGQVPPAPLDGTLSALNAQSKPLRRLLTEFAAREHSGANARRAAARPVPVPTVELDPPTATVGTTPPAAPPVDRARYEAACGCAVPVGEDSAAVAAGRARGREEAERANAARRGALLDAAREPRANRRRG